METVSPEWWKALEEKTLQSDDDDLGASLMKSYEGSSYGVNVPENGWRIALSHEFKEKLSFWQMVPLSQIPSLCGLAFRYLRYHRNLRKKGKRPCMDFFNQNPLRQIYGVPLGGIGGGTINRGWKGDFCRWQLQPGIYTYNTPLADQFIVTIRKNGKTELQQVLTCKQPSGKELISWNWKFCGHHAFYHGLYPRAWTVYHLKAHGVVLTCRQISPVFPHDYKDTSTPCAVFSWDIENEGHEDVQVTITMTMENSDGDDSKLKKTSGLKNERFQTEDNDTVGVCMHNTQYETMPYTMAVSAKTKEEQTISRCTSFKTKGDGNEVWQPLLNSGHLDDDKDESCEETKLGERIGCAVAVSCCVPAKSSSKQSVDFALAWDMPKVMFANKGKVYNRRYTRYFGSDGDAAGTIASYALTHYPEWEKKIDEWQKPVLDNKQLPSWYKSAIFNELYYISDGGTAWLEEDDTPPSNGHSTANGSSEVNPIEENVRNSKVIKEYGKFAYLEGHEYKMYNTYDVHFYASIALAHLWPKLELSVQTDIASIILRADLTKKKYLMDGEIAPVKTANVVPHDIGCPEEEPWIDVNTYFVHDTADWRDLNPKFVLQTHRDYAITKDKDFLSVVYPVCKVVMETSMKHDKDGDGLIENSGQADQTFDGWFVKGPSAYCGGLWIAALRCMVEGARVLNIKEDEDRYNELLNKATEAYQEHLWNGRYFNYDCSSNQKYRTSVMADQCAGQWFLEASNIADILPEEKVNSALKTVYDLNVMSYANGTHGAVNGMRPDGVIDMSSVQSDEVWTGVTYALAATLIHKGMLKEGFQTASGIYQKCWNQYGMAYQTPEAFKKNKTFRSLGYMRPLSIWGMQYALENLKKDT